jgi:hypothetical protein
MSDFVQTANVKRSVRNLTTKIAGVASLNTLVQGVIDTNAFQCVNHVVAGETHPGVSRGTQSFGIRVVYENPTTLKNMVLQLQRPQPLQAILQQRPHLSETRHLRPQSAGTLFEDTILTIDYGIRIFKL